MVRPDDEPSPLNIRPQHEEGPNDRQALLLRRALVPLGPLDHCEMRFAHSRCCISSNLITTVLVARQDSGCRITRARRTYIHIRTQSRARARAVKTQPHRSFAWLSQNILSRLLVIDLQTGKFRTIPAMNYRPAVRSLRHPCSHIPRPTARRSSTLPSAPQCPLRALLSSVFFLCSPQVAC